MFLFRIGLYLKMKKLIVFPFLIIFLFFINQAFVYSQNNKISSINQEDSSNLEDQYDELDDNADWAQPREMELMRYFKAQLEAYSNRDIEKRIEEIQSVLDKSTDMFCTVDADEINDKSEKLNLELDKILDKYTAVSQAPKAIRDNLINQERQLRQKMIRAIDDLLKNNGKCDGNNVPRFKVAI